VIARFLIWLKQSRCRHRVYIEDIRRLDDAQLVAARCHQCGSILTAAYGLALAAKLEQRPKETDK
jgi:hypothetical protein